MASKGEMLSQHVGFNPATSEEFVRFLSNTSTIPPVAKSPAPLVVVHPWHSVSRPREHAGVPAVGQRVRLSYGRTA